MLPPRRRVSTTRTRTRCTEKSVCCCLLAVEVAPLGRRNGRAAHLWAVCWNGVIPASSSANASALKPSVISQHTQAGQTTGRLRFIMLIKRFVNARSRSEAPARATRATQQHHCKCICTRYWYYTLATCRTNFHPPTTNLQTPPRSPLLIARPQLESCMSDLNLARLH